MAAPNTGKTFLLEVGGTKIAGQTDTGISISTGFADLSNKDTAEWRVKKPTYREWSGSVTGRVYATNTQWQAVNAAAIAGTSLSITVDEPDGGTYTGTAYVASLENRGGDESDHGYSITLEGSGALTYAS